MAVSKIVRIIAKKRAEDIAKKKIAKVTTQEARKIAVESQKVKVGGTRPLMRPKGMGNITTRPTNVPKKTTIKNIPKKSPEQTSKEKAVSRSFQKQDFWTGMKNPPKVKPKPTNVLHNRPRTLRQENAIGRQVNRFIKKQARLRQEVERKSIAIGKKPIEPKAPNRSIFEREMNLPAGTGSSFRRQQAVKQLKQEIQQRNEARADWQRQVRDSMISPKKTLHPSATEKSWQSDRNAIKAVKEAEKLAKANKTRKYNTGGGRPARKPRGN